MRIPVSENRYRRKRYIKSKSIWQYVEVSKKSNRVLRVLLQNEELQSLNYMIEGFEKEQKRLFDTGNDLRSWRKNLLSSLYSE